MKKIFYGIFSLAIVLIPAYSSLSLMPFLWNMTLIDTKFILSIGSIGMILFPILMKDLAYMFAEWQWEKYGETFKKHHLLFSLSMAGFGLFSSTFLFFNLTIPTSNITEKISTPILKVRTITHTLRRGGTGGWPVRKEAAVQIKNYIKDVKFPLEAEIKEGQLLSFSVRKGYFGFDVIEKL
jgi:hypothetical protein